MREKHYCLGLICLLGFLVQVATAENTYCPPLSTQVVEVTCDKAGASVPCDKAVFDTKARMMWTTTVINPNKNINRLVCKAPGVWEKRPPPKSAAGGGAAPATGGAAPAASAAAPAAPASPAPADYVNLAGGYYKLFKEPVGCRQAEKTCTTDGAKLLSVDSKAELKAIKEYLKKETAAAPIPGFYIGVMTTDFKTYTTIHGAPFPDKWLIKWASNEPSKQPDEQCFFVSPDDFKAHDVGLEGHAYSFICEFSTA